MRIRRVTPELRMLETARTELIALADSGRRLVEIRDVMGWLGVTWREDTPQNTQEPGSDPLTGCRPVTAAPDWRGRV